MDKTMTATEARKQFFNVIKSARRPGRSIRITHRGVPEVVIMSAEEYEGWEETFDIMSDPILTKDLVRALKSKEKGIPWEKVKKQMGL